MHSNSLLLCSANLAISASCSFNSAGPGSDMRRKMPDRSVAAATVWEIVPYLRTLL
jgi:hypothetical protein